MQSGRVMNAGALYHEAPALVWVCFLTSCPFVVRCSFSCVSCRFVVPFSGQRLAKRERNHESHENFVHEKRVQEKFVHGSFGISVAHSLSKLRNLRIVFTGSADALVRSERAARKVRALRALFVVPFPRECGDSAAV